MRHKCVEEVHLSLIGSQLELMFLVSACMCSAILASSLHLFTFTVAHLALELSYPIETLDFLLASATAFRRVASLLGLSIDRHIHELNEFDLPRDLHLVYTRH